MPSARAPEPAAVDHAPATARARGLDICLGVLVAIFSLLFLRYQYFMLKHIEWGDESETIVTAKMMAAGQLLYAQIFNHHGPLAFLPGTLLELVGDFGVRGHRVPIALLQIAGILAIYFSPIFRSVGSRVACALLAATIILFYIPDLLGHMYTYQAMVGLFILIVLFVYTLPAIMRPESLTGRRVFVGALLISGLPFLAITYLPVAVILFAVSVGRAHIKPALAGLLLGIAGNLVFILTYASMAGYLAFHIYMNAQILPQYLGSPTLMQLVQIAYISATADISQYVFLAIVSAGVLVLASHEKSFPWRSVLLALGTGSLLIRGSDFHGLPYYYCLIAFLCVPAAALRTFPIQAKTIAICLVCLCIAKASLLIPGDREKLKAREVPATTEFSELARKYTQQGDRIIAYSFQNFQYIAADRLPASGYFFYLPWQDEYNRNPQFGVKIDACQDIAAALPKVMLIDKWKVWGRFSWESYAGCVQDILDKHYNQVPDRPYYIRKDIEAPETRAPMLPSVG